MSPRLSPELKWDVPTPELLRQLIATPLPLRLRSSPPARSFHRDLYHDTPDGALARRGMSCRLRLGADDHRWLTVILPAGLADADGRERFDSLVDEIDPAAALAGGSEAARRLRGVVDPGALGIVAELETERALREASRGWPWSARLRLAYDLVTLRHGELSRGFQELKLHRLRPGSPALEQVSDALVQTHGIRPILESTLARAQRMLAALESEVLARSLSAGRTVTLIAVEEGKVALRPAGAGGLRLPSAEGRGEEACRHLLRGAFGSSVGDLALLGTAPGDGPLRIQEVWLARRLRRDTGADADGLVWVAVDEVLSRAGGPGLNDPSTLAALAVAARSDLLPEREVVTVRRPSRPSAAPVTELEPALLLDADLSLVEFNLRVLAMAEDPRTPLLERLGYLAIVSANLDEFFMVNVGALKQAPGSGRLEAVALRIAPLLMRQQRCLAECLESLARHGIRLRRWADLSAAERALLEERFRREIFPLLTPRAITLSPGFPVPVLPNLTICIGVLLLDAATGPQHFAFLKLPERVPRFLPVGGADDLIPLEEVVRANLAPLYPGRQVQGAHLFRLTRAGDLDLQDEDAGNLLQAVEEEVGRRAFNPIVRIEVEKSMPEEVRERLLWELRFERGGEAGGLAEIDIHEINGMMDLRALRELTAAPVAGGRFPPFEGRDPLPAGRGVWELLRERDLLVHHPYESFAATVGRFFAEAAADPDVASIRVTLYRAGERSPIVESLLHAVGAGKEVSIFVELKARFDESRNIGWVRRLEEAGANVVYGVVGLKNHAKVGLVLRREGDGLRRYVHIGTGNYNASTARLYTDLGLFSADPELGADVQDLFNQLTGSTHAPQGAFRRLAVAPTSLLPWLLERIEREIEHARAGRPARIRAKLNGLADNEVIQALYRASLEGVEIDLVIRGLCTLRPGVPNLSQRIRVISILGRFLEHARIYHFADGGEERYFIGSADWRPRNLRRRIEVVAPVSDRAARDRLARILDQELADPHAWTLEPDGSYLRRSAPGLETAPGVQERLIEENRAAPASLSS